MRTRLRRLASSPLVEPVLAATASLLEPVGRRRPSDVAILTYHRVDEPGARPYLHPGLISATPPVFETQLLEIARRANPISVADLRAAVRGERRLPDRPLLLTVDDAYEDFAEHAWPHLRKLGIPATLFVPTAYPGDPTRRFWWDRLSHALRTTTRRALEIDGVRLDLTDERSRLAAFRRLRGLVKSAAHERAMALVDGWCTTLDAAEGPSGVLDWTSLRSLAAEGVTIAAHSRTHPLLTRVDPASLLDEIAGSRDDLERELGFVPEVFAYPSGDHNDAVVAGVARSGFELAFTTVRGHTDLRHVDQLRLPRINVGSGTSIAALRLQLIRGAAAPLAIFDRG